MGLLELGVLLWAGAHFFKRAAPDLRARMGDAGKGVVAVAVVISIVLMVIGYRAADVVILWSLGSWSVHLNNLLMVIAVMLFGTGHSKSRLRATMRHPMLYGLLVWVVAHLLVNGDLASLMLFGGLGLWAMVTIRLINRDDPVPPPYTEGTRKGDIRLAVITALFFAVITGVHIWLGYWPFGG